MLTLRATLEPNGHLALPLDIRHDHPMSVLVTFLEEPVTVRKSGNAGATLALLQSPAFRALPKADSAEIEQRISQIRDEWDPK
jgi:hypothetical protein